MYVFMTGTRGIVLVYAVYMRLPDVKGMNGQQTRSDYDGAYQSQCYESFHMQKRISLHNRSTVIPCTGRHGSDDACDMVCEPLGKSWETLQLISLHVRALRRDKEQ